MYLLFALYHFRKERAVLHDRLAGFSICRVDVPVRVIVMGGGYVFARRA
jgi:hypothetical protein